MGGMVAQVLYRRHPSLLSGLVLCSTAANARGSRAERIAALAVPAMAAALQWNPMLHLLRADFFGLALLGRIDDPATEVGRSQLSRTSLATTISAMQAVYGFSSERWISQVEVPAAVVITDRDTVVPPDRQLQLARTIPGAAVHHVDGDHGACVNAPQSFARALLEACWSAEPPRGSTLRSSRARPTGQAP